MAGKLETSLSPKPRKPKSPAQDNQAGAVSLTPRTVNDFVLSGPSTDLTRPTHTWQAMCFTQSIYLNVNHLTTPYCGGAQRGEDGRGDNQQPEEDHGFVHSFIPLWRSEGNTSSDLLCVWLWLKVTLAGHPFHAHAPRPGLNVLVPAGAGPRR